MKTKREIEAMIEMVNEHVVRANGRELQPGELKPSRTD
jgi:hypothetical protein